MRTMPARSRMVKLAIAFTLSGFNVVLANYTYDALGRRIMYEDAVTGTMIRYYYDGRSAIEERDAGDIRLRYHIHGAQFIDEHVATFDQGTGQFTYYLPNANYSVAGTGNADGSIIDQLNYSATGDFAAGPPTPPGFYHDADVDTDIDLLDLASFQRCFGQPGISGCLAAHDRDTADVSDGDIDLLDWARMADCPNGPYLTPGLTCGRPEEALGPLATGTFAMHGRPIDVLSDGFVLQDFRARHYIPQLGRWLQRDRLGYIGGRNLYEAFGTNPASRLDPHGMDSVQRKGDFLEYTTDGFAWDFAKVIGNGLVLIDHPEWPFAFVVHEQDALSQFNTGPFADDYYSVFSIMAHATSLVTQSGSKNRIVALFDKRASSLRWITPDELENETFDELRRLGVEGLQAEVAGVGNLTATAFTVTTGALAAPAGAGATAVDVVATAADVASGRVSVPGGALVLTAAAAGAALHLRFADEAALSSGGVGRQGGSIGPLAPSIRTGAAGRIESVFAKLEPHHLSAGTRTTAEARQLAANLGSTSDDAGHIIGRALGGMGGANSRNIIPQSPHVNRGAFRAFEAMIAQRVSAGDEVFVRIVPRYRGAEARPFEILYQARINGTTHSLVFPNP